PLQTKELLWILYVPLQNISNTSLQFFQSFRPLLMRWSFFCEKSLQQKQYRVLFFLEYTRQLLLIFSLYYWSTTGCPFSCSCVKHRVHPCCSLHSCIWSFLSSYHIVALYNIHFI